MDDYIQIMKDILQEFYSTTPEGNKIEMQTNEVLRWFKGVIPGKPITEHEVFSILNELGYKRSQKIIKTEVQTRPGNKNLGIQPEFKEIETGRILVWNLYEKIE